MKGHDVFGLLAGCRRACATQVAGVIGRRRRHVVGEAYPCDSDTRLVVTGLLMKEGVLGRAEPPSKGGLDCTGRGPARCSREAGIS